MHREGSRGNFKLHLVADMFNFDSCKCNRKTTQSSRGPYAPSGICGHGYTPPRPSGVVFHASLVRLPRKVRGCRERCVWLCCLSLRCSLHPAIASFPPVAFPLSSSCGARTVHISFCISLVALVYHFRLIIVRHKTYNHRWNKRNLPSQASRHARIPCESTRACLGFLRDYTL